MLAGSVFRRLGAASEKARVPAFVVTLGRASKFELDDRLSVVSKYEGCLDERASWVICANRKHDAESHREPMQ